MRFQCERIITGAERRTSKSGHEYILMHFLDDEGRTFSCVSDVEVPDDIQPLEEVNVEFDLSTGRYKNLRVKRIWK